MNFHMAAMSKENMDSWHKLLMMDGTKCSNYTVCHVCFLEIEPMTLQVLGFCTTS